MNAMKTMGIPIPLGDADSVLDLELVKFCGVSGRVTDISGNPVNAVQVVTITRGAPDHVVWLACARELANLPVMAGTCLAVASCSRVDTL